MNSDALSALTAIVRSLGVLSARVAVMPAGHVAIDLQVDTEDDVRAAAERLGLSEPEHAVSDRHEWWHAERGEFGEERISVVGGHRPVCQCRDKQTS